MRTSNAATVGKVLLATGLAIGLTPVLEASAVRACSCIASTKKQDRKSADVVFKGAIVRQKGEVDGPGNTGVEKVTYTFKPTRTFKGTVRIPQKVRTSGSSAACGLRLADDVAYIVYAQRAEPAKNTAAARKRAAKKPLQINLCGGTRSAGQADRSPADPPGTF